MTLYQAYLNYKCKHKELEEEFRGKISVSGYVSPEIMVEFFNSYANAKEISNFIHYTNSHPLKIKHLLKFMDEISGNKWSCSAKLTNYIPDHIEEELQSLAEEGKVDFEAMQNKTFFEIYFHTTSTNPETGDEVSFVKPFTLSTTKPYKTLKKQKDLLENINLYECLLDGGFENQNAVWKICPDKETQSFIPNVVINYLKSVKISENNDENKREL
ncbi:MAG: hypothetical protein J6J24_03555 [Clostridia bacterium]|nr:hypothetical protein [Clostridia bacterium]